MTYQLRAYRLALQAIKAALAAINNPTVSETYYRLSKGN